MATAFLPIKNGQKKNPVSYTHLEIAEMVEQAPTEETVPDDTPVSEGEDVLAKYQELYLQNEDMVG